MAYPRPPLQSIFTWCGSKSNILERNKARDLATAIRDSERQGKARLEIVADGEEPAEMIQVEGSERWGWPGSTCPGALSGLNLWLVEGPGTPGA